MRSSEKESEKEERPASEYENLTMSNGDTSLMDMTIENTLEIETKSDVGNSMEESIMNNSNGNTKTETRLSQTHCLNTTVPINIAGTRIAGRHKPTKHALRHSRMIALNQSATTKNNTYVRIDTNARRSKLSKVLVILYSLLAIAILILSLLMLLWVTDLNTEDVPYWSGSLLLASGVLGLVFICYVNKNRHSDGICCLSIFKIICFLMGIGAISCCLYACICAIIHLIKLQNVQCEHNMSKQDYNNYTENINDVKTRSYRYAGLNCTQVIVILPILFISSVVLNFIGAILVAWYLYLRCITTQHYVTYSQVTSNNHAPLM